MLQTRTVEPRTLGLLKELMQLPILNDFYLVGGTALALQLGHRFSIDLDLFTTEPFSVENLISEFSENAAFSVESESPTMLISYIDEVKVDFVKMSYPILFPTIIDEGVRMLDIRDIAPMKLKAVTQRGSKKDFYDIFYLLNHLTLGEMLLLFKEKFKQQEVFHVMKSLVYFQDAEQYPDPVLFDEDISWGKVKAAVNSAVGSL